MRKRLNKQAEECKEFVQKIGQLIIQIVMWRGFGQ